MKGEHKDDDSAVNVEGSSNETRTKTDSDLEAQKASPEIPPSTTTKGDNPKDPIAPTTETRSLSNTQSDAKKEQSKPNDDNLHYPKDSYSFMALHGPFECPAFFWLGFTVFLLQSGFFAVIIASVFHPVWSKNGQDDNPGGTFDVVAQIVPSNASPIVRATQVLVSISYIFITDASMDDFATAFDIYPMKSDANNDDMRRIRFSCGMRLVQGLLALFAAIILIVSSNDAIEIVLNFTALNFVSNFDNVVFVLALGGKYGEVFQKGASDINEGQKLLPECMRSRKVHHRYLLSVVISAIILFPCVFGVIWAQSSDDIWVTKVMRVEFEGVDLHQFTGCYSVNKQSNYTTYGRAVYDKNTTAEDDEERASFAYCADGRRWLLLDQPGEEENVCTAGEKELAYSSKTESFDVFTEFDEQWFSASGAPLTLNFIDFTGKDEDCSLLENGECDAALNEYEYRYDGGDCCSATCNNPKCASFVNIEDIFGVQNVTGIHFPYCEDPQMKDITIHVSNFTSSWDRNNLDVLYPKRQKLFDGNFNHPATDPDPTRLTLECDGRYALVIDVTNRISDQTATVRVKDGSNCIMKVKTKAKNENCSICHETEDPFWVFDYAIYEGNTTDNVKKILGHNSVEQGDASFLRIPECFSRKLSENGVQVLNMSNLYRDDLVMEAIEWMTKDTSGYSNCRDEGFLQRFQLILFFYNLNPVDEQPAGFIQSSPTCLWENVECQDGELYGLDLTALDLKEDLPSTIGLLTSMRVLDVEFNQISNLPTEIGNLEQLAWLDFSSNQISMIPSEIGNLEQLTSLDLTHNQISIIPAEIGNLKQLSSLDLSYNQIISAIPMEIGGLHQLTSLKLRSNAMTTIPTEIGNLKHLASLELSFNKISAIPTEIGNLKHLASLELSLNTISVISTEIGNMSRLTSLKLSLNTISVIPTEIGKLEQLVKLDLWSNRISAIPTEIGNLKHLTSLHLWYNVISVIPSEIGKLTALRFLDLSDNVLSGELPSEIGLLTSLTCLVVRRNPKLTISDSLRATIYGFPKYDSDINECSLESLNSTTIATP